MARTLANAAEELSTGSIMRALLNTATAGSAVIAKVIAGTNVTLASTGADAGTGDVTINVAGFLAVSTNAALGSTALTGLSSGTNNTAVGGNALKVLSTSTNNTACGYNALAANTSGVSNVAIGSGALVLNSTTSNNVAVGQGTLASNTGGGSNVALGTSALSSNTNASSNTAIGPNALYSTTTGGNNVGIGQNVLFNNIAGVSNTAIGSTALFDLNGASAHYNTAIGYNSGRGITTGTTNTIIGAQVAGLAAGLTGAVILASGDGVIKLDYGKTTAAIWTFSSPIKAASYTVAGLPSASSSGAGAKAFVTDALTPTFGATVAGSGAVNSPVYSDGTNWKVG